MRNLTSLLRPFVASMALCVLAPCVLAAGATAAAAEPKEIYLGDIASPKAALNGKTFSLKAGQRLRFTNVQKRTGGAQQLLYFYGLTATPARTLYHGAMALSPPAGVDPSAHYRQETFSVLKAAPVGTTIQIRTTCPYSAAWTLAFKIKVVP